MLIVGFRQALNLFAEIGTENVCRFKEVRKLAKHLCTCQCSLIRHLATTAKFNATVPARLTPQDVTSILRTNEGMREFTGGGTAVHSYEFNQIGANDPIEDTKNEALFLPKQGHLFAVFDGHAGGSCAHVLAKRIFHYIAANMATPDQLLSENPLLEVYSDRFEFVDVLRELYAQSYEQYRMKLSKDNGAKSPGKALTDACLALDADISREAIENHNNPRLGAKTLSVATSGAVTALAYVEGSSLHVATVGDCQAVLGVFTHDTWRPKLLSVPHNADNADEVKRIINEHPPSEQDNIIKFHRLFGELAPLRAFGDVRYKWETDLIKQIIVPRFGDTIPRGYSTPPYLTAEPHVMTHTLTPKDKFLILATDGLWDFITPHQAVRLIGEHMAGRTVLTPFSLPSPHMTLAQINEALLVRKACLDKRPEDQNGSTHLIRSALSSTEYGLDQIRIAKLLALPQGPARNYRDDITVIVVYFDEEYLRHNMIIPNKG